MSKTLFDSDEPKMTTTALAPWFGSNRMLAPMVGESLRGCKWVGVPFAGGMSELAHIKASTIVVGDLHRHVIHLACVVKDDSLRAKLIEKLDAAPFHPDALEEAQRQCANKQPGIVMDVDLAAHYFIASWMGRSHKCGIDDEFNGGLSTRWNANGGDSNKRYRSAVASLQAWGEVMRRCNFVVLDVFDFLDRAEDSAGHGIYCDPPFPGPGDRYKHQFTEAQHTRLAHSLSVFTLTKVVCRFYDHPLIRKLYPPEGRWKWTHLEGRKQSNDKAPEVLIAN